MKAKKVEVKENTQQKAEREMWATIEIKQRYNKYRHALSKGVNPTF